MPLPKKSFGQNFLTSIPARIKIVNSGDLKNGDTVLEIGPGRGFLTEELLKKDIKVIAVEKDYDLIPQLESKFEKEIKDGKLKIINEDILDFQIEKYFKNVKYKLIANIPYYITGAIISKFLSNNKKPETVVLLVQKEVAKRVVANDKKESLLSLSVKVYGDPFFVSHISRGSFFPSPKVDSAILCIKNILDKKYFKNKEHEKMFFDLIHLAFAHKRKYAISNIKEKYKNIENLFLQENLSLKTRAEDVTIEKWISISLSLATS